MTTTRRTALALGATVLAGTATAATASAETRPRPVPGEPQLTDRRFHDLLESTPVAAPTTRLALRAVVDIADGIDLGASPWGHRYLVLITGGRFAGPGLAGEGIEGVVRPGGADRQLQRQNGIKDLEAIYELETDDGAVLSVVNLVISDPRDADRPYRRSTVTITAPEGRYGWLNERKFVGTLQSLRPERQAVLISVFIVE
ncbi:DUF3237 domain-containing protein [Citricoccus sp. SGAir0253]|uniref:DUF3237 domain-containing protein n=1 Tax=Citricoccus sp. SGAir0253 TaxID=2567881 RepID=UPI0010CD0BBC|nr:DUF3237 domain-containing protein [Citricoccus sp. SGAir0253]QCU78949.1 DUF3237 domain-containing protein [Citricoccus sp. SGAir0253]